MAAAWHGPGVPLVADGDARTTAGNARAVAAARARRLGATEVVAVTSAWHRRRARALLRAALGPDVELELVAPGGRDRLEPARARGRLPARAPASVRLPATRR